MITAIKVVNTSVTSHGYQVFGWWEVLDSPLLAPFRYTTQTYEL